MVWLLLVGALLPLRAESPQIRSARPAWMSTQEDDAGWSSERLQSAAGARLKKLAYALDHEGPIDATELASWVDPAFVTTGLLPAKSAPRFESSAIGVRRYAPSVTSTKRFEGPSGLAAALGQLEQQWGGGAAHAHFKIVEIELFDDGRFETLVRVELAAPSTAADYQVIGRWRMGWIADEGSVRLLRLELLELEEARLSSGRWFEDVSESVLGGNAAWREQLIHGHEYWMRRIEALKGIDNFGHHGIALGDVNGDGLDDLYLSQTGGLPNRLFVHEADGSLTDRSAEAGVDFMERTHAALLLDLDNDGDQDLIAATQIALLVLANDGSGKFERRAELALPAAFSLAAADYDLDGDLDLYACNYASPTEWAEAGGLGLQPIPYHDANNGPPNALFRNDGGFEFVNVTQSVGLDRNNRRWSFAASWEDYDLDGDVDLYVANDFGRNNLYRNDGGQFVDVASSAGVEDAASGMSVSWGDANGDGLSDLYVGNMFSSAGGRIVPQAEFQPGADQATRDRFQRFSRGNTLFLNSGDGSFDDVSAEAGVGMGRWAWGSNFVDLNNDGDEDLVVCNGFITNEDTGDL